MSAVIAWPPTRLTPGGEIRATWGRWQYCKATDRDRDRDCDRRCGHSGRHFAWAWDNGRPDGKPVIVAVWGEDVHADARQRGRDAINARAAERLFEVIRHLEAGLSPKAAWAIVEGYVAGADSTAALDRSRAIDALDEGVETHD